jgi:predicted nuclease of predicted toxin-antitoxin system
VARLYADENVEPELLEALAALNHDVVTCVTRREADAMVLAFAHREGCILLTHNTQHFRRLHRRGQPHSGIVAMRPTHDLLELARRIDDALADAGPLAGRMLVVTRAGLPLLREDPPPDAP